MTVFSNIKRKSIGNSIICMKLFRHLPHTKNDMHSEWRSAPPSTSEKSIHSNDLPGWSRNFFRSWRKLKILNFNYMLRDFFAVGCAASVMGWLARQWRILLLGLPKSQLAYIANNRRYVNFGAFFSRGMFDSRFFCHDSINSAFIPRQFAADNWPEVACVGTAGWGLGVAPIVAFLSLSVSLSTFKLRQSYEPWIIPSGPKNHQIWA